MQSACASLLDSAATRTRHIVPLPSTSALTMLAGLPQNPARHNPAVNPKRAHQRQQVVLRRLFELGDITQAQYNVAVKEPLRILLILKLHDEVVGETHDDHIPVRVTTSPPLGPQVEDIVQVHISEQR